MKKAAVLIEKIPYWLRLFLLLQILVVVSWFFGERLLPIRTETFLGRGLGEHIDKPLIWSRANFDGFYYAKIARDGYQYLQQAFFPFYPQLIKFFQPFFKSFNLQESNSFILSGIFISSACFIFCLYFFGRLFREEGEEEKTIRKALLFLVLFPTSFYFISVYTESVFLFLVLLAFWLAKKRKWLLAGLIGGLASYTRLAGVFLLPALLYEYYDEESRRTMKERVIAVKQRVFHFDIKYLPLFLKSRLRHIQNIFFISLSSWGLIYYMSYLKRTVNDPFYFIKVQPGFGAQRSINRLIMLYQVFWRYLKMIFTVDCSDWIYFTVWLELLIGLLFIGLLILGWTKFKLKKSWMIFATLAYVLPTLTGTFSSMPRYILVCFPCFLILSKLKLPKLIFVLSLLLLLICTILFVRGYWIG